MLQAEISTVGFPESSLPSFRMVLMYMCSTFRLNDPWCRLQGEGGQERGQLSAVGPGAGTQSFQRGLSASCSACSEHPEETEKAFKLRKTEFHWNIN